MSFVRSITFSGGACSPILQTAIENERPGLPSGKMERDSAKDVERTRPTKPVNKGAAC